MDEENHGVEEGQGSSSSHRRLSTPQTSSEESEEEEEEEALMEDNGSFPDTDLLKCPICVELFTTHVYQCRNGHMPCSSCYAENENKCPWCSLPMGDIRCFRMEKILESSRRPCENKKYGCREMVDYTQNNGHGLSCAFSPCFCPMSGCNFEGSSSKLYTHFSRHHTSYAQSFRFDEIFTLKLDRTKSFILREVGGTIFALNHWNEVNGSSINVVRMAPVSAGVLPYGLRARYGEASNILHSSVSSCPKWEENTGPESEYLVIPFGKCASSEIHLDVVICSQPEVLWGLWRRFCFSSLDYTRP